MTLTLGFVTGTTPDKWARIWRERHRERLELVPVTESDQEERLRSGEVEMCLARLPIDETGLHRIRLYDELSVAVMSRENALTLLDDLTLADLDEEQLVLPHRSGWRPRAEQLDWPPMTEQDAVVTVAAGTGIAIMPMSVARLYHRRDVEYRVITDLDPTTIALTWPIERDDDRLQRFVGVVRGRTERSTRH